MNRSFISLLFLMIMLTTLHGVSTINDNTLSKSDILTGNFNAELHEDFSVVPQRLVYRKIYRKIFLRKETLQAFLEMEQDAQHDGIVLKIVSGFRSYKHQSNIWKQKFKTYAPTYPNINERVSNILNYSAIPGISRHHWGTDIDINSLNNNYFLQGSGNKVHRWLEENAKKYEFYLTYTFGRTGGYQPEMWHYTYYPSSSKMMKDFYLYMTPRSLPSFKGSGSIDLGKIFYQYSFNINPHIINKLRIDGISIILSY